MRKKKIVEINLNNLPEIAKKEEQFIEKVELASKIILKEDEKLFKEMAKEEVSISLEGTEKQGMSVFAQETDIDKLEREIKEHKKLLKQKRKEEEERVKREELEKKALEEANRKAQEEELLKKQEIIPALPTLPINREDKFLLLPDEVMLKVCPNCNNPKLKKSWVKRLKGNNISQKFSCKFCGFKKEIIMRI